VSELRFGGVNVYAAEATLCNDMAIAPVGPRPVRGGQSSA